MAARARGAGAQDAGDASQGSPDGRGVALVAGVVSQAKSKPARVQKLSEPSPLEAHLLRSMQASGFPEPVREYRFHPTRKWRLDFAWPAVMLAVEIEGGIYRGGGHTHVKDLKRDIDKGNALTLLGWRLLRFHGDQVRSGEATDVIRQALDEHAQPAAGD